ncbi:MAG: HAD-IA family hydrolase [Clostridiales bacterium]|nr:HAD-IA family hydrolase [Clostridiales bacterium]
MIKAIYFDLFFTLIIPEYDKGYSEFDILNLSLQEWEKYAEDADLYRERALGLVKSEREIIEKIAAKMPFDINDIQKEKVIIAREKRMETALQNVSENITDILKILKSKGLKLGLISNADIIDCKYWEKSGLDAFFDNAVFSCNVGLLKPDKRIYELAMHNLNVLPSECLFVGDGGSNELYGAKSVGMKTVFTEALEIKSGEKRSSIMENADYYIRDFGELLYLEGLT